MENGLREDDEGQARARGTLQHTEPQASGHAHRHSTTHTGTPPRTHTCLQNAHTLSQAEGTSAHRPSSCGAEVAQGWPCLLGDQVISAGEGPIKGSL